MLLRVTAMPARPGVRGETSVRAAGLLPGRSARRGGGTTVSVPVAPQSARAAPTLGSQTARRDALSCSETAGVANRIGDTRGDVRMCLPPWSLRFTLLQSLTGSA